MATTSKKAKPKPKKTTKQAKPVSKVAKIKAPAATPAPAEVVPVAVHKEPRAKKTAQHMKVPKESYYGTGKRKTAIAKVWIFKGSGKLFINKKPAMDYIKSDILVQTILSPLKKLNLEAKYDVIMRANGGGLVAQAEAGRLGVTRALLVLNPDFRKALKEEGYITRDPRIKERKKYGRKKARKGFQYRKR